jgi:hypothetical protein
MLSYKLINKRRWIARSIFNLSSRIFMMNILLSINYTKGEFGTVVESFYLWDEDLGSNQSLCTIMYAWVNLSLNSLSS